MLLRHIPCLLFAFATAGCPRANAPLPGASPDKPKPDRSVDPPTVAQCEALWVRYHGMMPDDPYVAHDAFVARCNRSEPAVLQCPEQARAKVVEIVRETGKELDAGPSAAEEQSLIEMLSRVGMPPHNSICMARERLRYALRTGELAALGKLAGSGTLHLGEHGTVVVQGTYATLATTGIVERERAAELGPEGEIRIKTWPDSRVWIYFLGGLLGRHQNQVGFLYSTTPFAKEDFRKDGDDGREQVCIQGTGEDERAPGKGMRYMLSCFTVVDRLSPQLIEVGSAPD
ncbi:MAG: hypothetical protein HY898_23930 [Deltaproteobacteria bacterium]|nr:hypothetical protein [Deltaproteobacteria bacterium]